LRTEAGPGSTRFEKFPASGAANSGNAPDEPRIWNDPPRSLSFTCAGPVPSLWKESVRVVVVPSTCVVEIDVGEIVR
jgi:hypothetical protein